MHKDKHSHKFHCLLHSAELLQEYLRVQLLPLGVSPSQARVVKALGFLGPISQIELAREFGITAASMSTMTSRLIALDLIASSKDPNNAKRNLTRLTPKGEALLDDIDQAWSHTDAFMTDSMGDDKANTLSSLACELRDALGGRKPGAK
ncbi:MarR family transcriptional regulator [Leucothrix sargassi]|nr:MarR family transcriptional regulator [Leucothrix sargassi]